MRGWGLLLLVTVGCFAQKRVPSSSLPPNCIRLTESLFMDKTEITNADWFEFLWTIRRDSGQAYYTRMLPDSSLVESFAPFKYVEHLYAQVFNDASRPFHVAIRNKNGYYRYRELAFLPMVGITFEQARDFCLWRTRMTAARLGHHRITYRLPTEEEWIYAASAGLDTAVYSFGYKDYEIKTTLVANSEYYWKQIKDTTKLTHHDFTTLFQDYTRYGREPFFNCTKKFLKFFAYGTRQLESAYDRTNRPPKLMIGHSIFTEDRVDHSSAYFTKALANGYGFSHMIGNAAEMTLQKGIARGGSFAHSLSKSKISQRYYYYTPSNWLGFRCVAELKAAL